MNDLLGLSACLSLWVMPIIKNPANKPRNMITQFDDSINRGERFLLPSSRLLGTLMASSTFLCYQSPDDVVAAKWKYYAATMFVVMQVAWFEIVFIFPVNGAVRAMGEKFDAREKKAFSKGEEKELLELLDKWSNLHTFRVLAPLIGACISVAAVVQ